MMLLRHTNDCVKHKKTMSNTQTSFQLEREDSTQMPPSSCHQAMGIEESGAPASPTWLRIQSLLQHLSFMEMKGLNHLSPPVDSFAASVSVTPCTVHLAGLKQPEYFNSSKCSHSLPSTILFGSPPIKASQSAVAGLHCKNGAEEYEPPCPYPSVGSLTSAEYHESPTEKAVDMERYIPAGTSLDVTGCIITADMVDDTTDSMQVLSSDYETTGKSSKTNYNFSQRVANKRLHFGAPDAVSDQQPTVSDLHEVQRDLAISDDQLQLSFFGLVKISKICITFGVESIQTVLEVKGITGSVDCRRKHGERQVPISVKAVATNNVSARRHTQFIYKILPTYLSVASQFQQFNITVLDPAISKR